MTQVQKGIYANRTDIHGKPTRGLVRYSSREREKKGNCEKTDKRQNTDTDSTDKQGLIKFARPRTSHFTPRRVVGQPTRLPPPTPFCTSPPSPEPDSQTSHQAAVTSEILSDGGLIQCAAAMRVTRVATISSDAKTTPGKQQAGPNLSADSPFRSRSYADFITDLELHQAKAEVEGVLLAQSLESRARGHAASGPTHDGGRARGPAVAAGGLRACWRVREQRKKAP